MLHKFCMCVLICNFSGVIFGYQHSGLHQKRNYLTSIKTFNPDDDFNRLDDSRHKEYVIPRQSKIKIIEQNNIYLSNTYESPTLLFKVFGEYLIVVDDNTMVLHFHKDGKVFLEFDSILPIVDEVMFIEVIETRNIAFVLMSFNNGKANLYTSYLSDGETWSKFALKQVISRRESNLAVAKFVTLGNDVYLVVGYTHGTLYGADVSIIYSWRGSYFDESIIIDIKEIVDISIIKKDKETFLLLIGENSLQYQKTDILLYEYSSVDGLMRLSTLPTDGATMLFSYEIQNRGMQLLAVNNGVGGSLYEIKNNAIIPDKFLNLDFNVTCGFVIDNFQYPFILLGGENFIILYDTYDKSITTLKLSDVLFITDLHVMEKGDNGHFNFLAVCKGTQSVSVRILEVIVKREKNASGQSRPENKIKEILEKLKVISEMMEEKQNFIEEVSRKVREIRTIENVYYDGVLNLNFPVTIKSSVIGNLNLLMNKEEEKMHIIQMNKTLKENELSLANVESKMARIINKGKTLEIFDDLIFDGDLYINNFVAGSVYTESLNNNSLSYEPISLDGEDLRNIKQLRVFNLTVEDYELIPNEELIIKSLEIDNLFIESGCLINGIDPNNIVTRDFNGMVEGQKTFQYLDVENLVVQTWNGVHLIPESEKIDESKLRDVYFNDNITIKDLYVDEINGINMKSLMSNTFQRGIYDKIKGNLTFVTSPNIENLNVIEYDGIPVDLLFTKATPQNVTAKLMVRNMLIENATVDKINGLNLEKDVAIIGNQNIITTPVTIGKVDTKNLLLKCGDSPNSFCDEPKIMNFGKLQIYEKPLEIIGDLTVSSLNFKDGVKLLKIKDT